MKYQLWCPHREMTYSHKLLFLPAGVLFQGTFERLDIQVDSGQTTEENRTLTCKLPRKPSPLPPINNPRSQPGISDLQIDISSNNPGSQRMASAAIDLKWLECD